MGPDLNHILIFKSGGKFTFLHLNSQKQSFNLENHSVQNIIFDLGGVIINIDFALTIRAFESLSPVKVSLIREMTFQSDFFLYYEKGQVDDLSFVEELHHLLELEEKHEEIKQAWNALLLDIPRQRIDLLENLGKTYRTFLLSNTNEIHLKGVETVLEQTSGHSTLDPLFERTYYSHRMGKRKPDKEIYFQVLEENNLSIEHTLLIDDNADNIASAKTLGMQVLHIQPDINSVMDFFVKNETGYYQLKTNNKSYVD